MIVINTIINSMRVFINGCKSFAGASVVRSQSNAVHIMLLIVALTITGASGQLRETRQLTSNNIIALAGSGDTLWLATDRGFNYRTSLNSQDGWPGFEANDLQRRLWGLAFGGGGAAAVISNHFNSPTALYDYIGFWHFDHVSGRQQERHFRFSHAMREENDGHLYPVGGVIYARGNFWVPFGSGGMVRYNPANNTVHTMRPNDVSWVSPQDLAVDNSDENNRKKRRVLSLVNLGGDSILVTTPLALWVFVPAANTWEILQESPEIADNSTFASFNAAFTLNSGNDRMLFSFITADTLTNRQTKRLMRFDVLDNRWHSHLRNTPAAIFPAQNGAFYSLFDDNGAALYQSNDTTPIISIDNFRAMLARAGDDPNPQINDILFLRRTDTTGVVVVAAGMGLYTSDRINPLTANSDAYNFALIRYVRSVGRGEAYALPGIIRGGGRYDRCVFVYKLKRDGNVTIRVYDYNMSLVKTVVRGERRTSNAERSNNPARDIWDGTNEAGRLVSPGVYYFKITSTGGERFFGRVILAKQD